VENYLVFKPVKGKKGRNRKTLPNESNLIHCISFVKISKEDIWCATTLMFSLQIFWSCKIKLLFISTLCQHIKKNFSDILMKSRREGEVGRELAKIWFTSTIKISYAHHVSLWIFGIGHPIKVLRFLAHNQKKDVGNSLKMQFPNNENFFKLKFRSHFHC